MKWPFAYLVSAALGAIVAGPIQEEAISDPKLLFDELQKKFEALGPVSATLSMESIDAKGNRTPRYKGTLHLRLSESWLHFEMKELGKEEPPTHTLFDGDRSMLVWKPGAVGKRVQMNSILREVWNHSWHCELERQKVLKGTEVAKNLDDFISRLRPVFHLGLDANKPGAPEPAAFRFAMGKSKSGRVSWLTSASRDFKVSATSDEVIVRDTTAGKTTTIDRRTGFMRSIRVVLASGEGRMVTAADLVSKATKPVFELPDRWTERSARISDVHAMFPHLVKDSAIGSFDDLLNDWQKVDTDEGSEALREFFAWIGGEQAAVHKEAARVTWAMSAVKQMIEQGASLDDLSGNLEEGKKKFEAKVRAAGSDPKMVENFEKWLDSFREELEKAASEVPGSEEAKKLLIQRIREGFALERVRKARTSRAMPEAERFLREAIDAAREKESK